MKKHILLSLALVVVSFVSFAQTWVINGPTAVCSGDQDVYYNVQSSTGGLPPMGSYTWKLDGTTVGMSFNPNINLDIPTTGGSFSLEVFGPSSLYASLTLTESSGNPGTVSLSGGSCSGGSLTIQVSGNSGSLKWQRKVGTGSWSDHAIGFPDPLGESGLTVGTQYQYRVRTNSSCTVEYSNVLTVTPRDPVGAGTASGSQSICSGETPSAITATAASGGIGSYTYSWEKKPSGGSWSNIGGGSSLSPSEIGALTVTTEFRRKVTDTQCGTGYSNIVTVSIHANLSAGSINGAQTICYSGDPTTIGSSSLASGGDGSYSYQWQYSTNGTSGWVDITTNGTGSTYNPPSGLTSDRWYRREVVSCNQTEVTGTIKVTVRPNLVAGSINGMQTICYSGDPTTIGSSSLASGGDGSYSYQWQYSTNGTSGWVDITTNGTGSTYNPPSGLTSDRWYRREVVSCNQTEVTGTIKVTVRPNLVAGSINGAQTICYSGDPTTIGSSSLASGGDGSYSYQWQYSTNGTSGWVDITTNGTGSTYNPPSGLTSDRWYRREVVSCNQTEVTGTIKVTVRPNLVAGSINGTQTICYSGDPTTIGSSSLASGGDGSYSYQWQYSTNGTSGWVDITTNGTGSTYNPPSGLTSDRWYRREVVSCNQTEVTGTIKVTVRPNLVAGSINGTQTICYSGDPTTIGSSSLASGGDGSYSYQWQYSTNGTSGWVDITTNGTGSTYNPPSGLTSDRWYRREVVSCNQTEVTGTIKVTVRPNLVAGSINGTQTICYSGDPTTIGSSSLASGGDGSYSYQWQYSTNGTSGWVDITTNGTGSTYNPPSGLTSDRWYRREVVSCNQTEVTGTIKVTVRPNLVAGSINGTQTICYSGDPTTIGSSSLASGGDGSYSYQWQYSTNGTSGWVDITTNGTGSTYNPPSGLTSDRWYRREVVSCNQTEVTGTIKVTVDSPTIGGTLTSDAETFGIASGTLNLAGEAGSILKWQYQTTGGWLDLANTTDTYNYVNIIEPTRYRVQVQNGTCPIQYSNEVLINVLAEPTMDLGVQTNVRPGGGTTITTDEGHSNYHWFKDGVSFQNGTSNALEITHPGLYKVIVTSSGGAVYETGEASIANQMEIGENSVITYTYRVPVTNADDPFIFTPEQQSIAAQVYDGLGRPIQQVSMDASPQMKDVVVPMEYDAYGRQLKKYLPYVESDVSVLNKPNALNANYAQSSHYDFYVNESTHASDKAFSEVLLESSPLNRPLEQGAPGGSWQLGQNTVKFAYGINGANEVIEWKATTMMSSPVMYYDAGELFRNTTIDEDGNATVAYADKQGQTILKKSMVDVVANDTTWAETYYIYDIYGQLVVVIPPEASDRLSSEFFGQSVATRTDFLNTWAFLYDYDGRNRMTMKKVPGADSVFMVYDQWDRLVLTQDGNQRNAGEWLFTKYDRLNRPIITGMMESGRSVGGIRSTVAASIQRFDTLDATQTHQYRALSFPTDSISEYLTVTYYDKYDFQNSWTEDLDFYNADSLNVVDMNGTNQYIALNHFYNQANSISELTIEAWINTSYVGTSWNENWAIIDFDRSEFYNLFVHGIDGRVGFSTKGGNVDDFYSLQSVNDGQWHHIAAVFDGTNKRIYIDGALDNEIANPHGGSYLGKNITRYGFIGDGSEATSFDGNRNETYFEGQIGEVRLWHLTRSGQDIDQYKEIALSGNEPGLIGMWTMNDMSNGLPDETGNGHDGTLVNGPAQLSTAGTMPLIKNDNVKGQVTGTMTKAGDGTWIKSVSYYDDKYRLIQAQSTNHLGGKDVATNYLDFIGQPLKTIGEHYGGDTLKITRYMTYDHTGRMLELYHQLNNETASLLSSNSYNELGELIEKDLHSGTQSLDYAYNIRGWLTSVNEADLSQSNDGDLFGMELLYDAADGSLSNNQLYNGNISAMKWSDYDAPGAGISERAYTYGYDQLNRLKTASHFEDNTSTSKYGVQGLNYDLNGNIESLQRRSTGTSAHMDDLTYAYTGNQLQYVSDASTDSLGFHDGNTSGNDYAYDANGNMVEDKNKGIDSIYYNHLNLPVIVDFETAGDSIVYLYDAAGIKLQQKVFRADTLFKTTDYVGEFIYENGVLEIVQHEEGRIVPKDTEWDYQYHLKDHLGNVRMTFSTTPENYEMIATMEDSNEAEMFSNYVADADGAIANSGTYVSRNSNTVNSGLDLNTFLSVNKGDTIKASAYAYYNDASGSYNLATGLIETALFGSFNANYGAEGTTTTQTNFDNAFGSGTALGDRSTSSSTPPAYINYIFFDKEMGYVTASFAQITSASNGAMALVTAADFIPDRDGYVMIYLSNETSGSELIVSWDDFTVYHGKTNVVSVQDYYPFGLTFNESVRTASSPQRWKFNGKELDENTNWYDYQLRQYDPELGVWHAIDPSAESYYGWSAYSYVFNNPVKYIDPDGADPENPLYTLLGNIGQGIKDTYNKLTSSDVSQKEKLNTVAALTLPVNAINVASKITTGDYENISQDEALSAVKEVAGVVAAVATAGESKMATLSDDLAGLTDDAVKVADEGALFRGDSRAPSDVLENGFSSKGSNMDLLEHATFSADNSAYISTSKSKAVAESFAGAEGYVYKIDGSVKGVDVNKALGKNSPYPKEKEVAVPFRIPPDKISLIGPKE